MEAIGDHFGIGEEGLNEAFIAVTEIEGDEFYVFPAWNILQLLVKLGVGFSESDFAELLMVVIDDHGDELSFGDTFLSSEGVLIDSDLG